MAALPLHGADVGARADLRCAPHDGQLVRVFHQAHFVQHAAQVALGLGAQGAETHPGAHLLQPAVHAAFQAGVRGERVPDGVSVFQQAGQAGVELGHGEGLVHAQRLGGGLRAQADAVPDLALQVLGLAEQGGAALGRDHQPAIGLAEAGEVIEVAVVPVEEVAVAVALALRRGGDDGDAAIAQLGGHAGAAFGVEGIGSAGVHGGHCGPNGMSRGSLRGERR